MKFFLTLLLLTSFMSISHGQITDFQWKSRILILSAADETMQRLLVSEKPSLEERDLKIFILTGNATEHQRPSPELAKKLITHLALAPETPMICLIGKDGVTTLKWAPEAFTFQKLYASIDAMPMRQLEIKRSAIQPLQQPQKPAS